MLQLKLTNLEVSYENINLLSNEEYAKVRKTGLGATDSSVYLGLMKKFKKDKADVVAEKIRPHLTEQEKAIGQLEAVRKGRDLEPLILEKYATLTKNDIPIKPNHMYRIKDYPHLNINFDGVQLEKECYIPIECKFVTSGGDKNYDPNMAVMKELPDYKHSPRVKPNSYVEKDIVSLIEYRAAQCGIPPYYYPQVQQQIAGLNAPYGYLVALHDKGWQLCIYKIPRDQEVINKIFVESTLTWSKIKQIKGEA